MTVEVTTDEVVDFLFRLNVQVLELVHCRELLDVQTVWQNTISCISSNPARRNGEAQLTWFPLEEVF